MKRLTPQKIAAIRLRKGQGATYKDLAAEFSVSEGTIRNALKSPEPSREPLPEPPPSAPEGEADQKPPPTIEELRGYLGEQIRTLRIDLAKATDAGQKAAGNRALVTAQALLTRIMPPPPPPDPNKSPDMIAAAARARPLLHLYFDQASK